MRTHGWRRAWQTADGRGGLEQDGGGGQEGGLGDVAGLAGADFLLAVVLLHQPLGLVDGLDLLLQGDVGLRCLLGAGHAARVAVPGHLKGRGEGLYKEESEP